MQKGKVKFYDESKGIGFIKDDAYPMVLSFHVTDLNTMTIQEEDRVSFEKRGLSAANISKID
jgi:cold shock CspA family protein